MPSNPLLRFRRSAAQLHALTEVERTIRSTDTKCRRKYLKDFSDAFQTYQRVLKIHQVEERAAEADLVLVGDYHALPASQRFTASLIERIVASGRSAILGVEAIVARDQHILDEWQNREIDTEELRNRIRFESDWGYEWQPFRELLERARLAGVRVYGLDCTPRQDMRSIRARDRHAAVKIAGLRESNPDAVTVVLFGESHLAPNHLPLLLRELRPKDDVVTVLQNVDSLYWLSAGEPQDLVEAVEARKNVMCAFSATPLEKYEHYRICIERWKGQRAGTLDLAPSFYNLISSLLRFLNVDPYEATGNGKAFLVDELPEVWSVSNEEQLERLLSRRMSTRIPELTRMVRQKGSWFVPDRNVIVAHEFRMPWAAEQAARFVSHVCRRDKAGVTSAADDFYSKVLENALAFFGSKVLCPSRRLYDRTQLRTELQRPEDQTTLSKRAYDQTLTWVLAHLDMPQRPRGRRSVIGPEKLDKAQRDLAATMIGNLLGSDLYSAYVQGGLSKRYLRKLFFSDLSKPGTASKLYFGTCERVPPAPAWSTLRVVS